MTTMEAIGSFTTTRAECRVSATELYEIERAYSDETEWYARYYGADGPVEIDTQDDDGNAVWWDSVADARIACAMHYQLMQKGDSAEYAAAAVRMCTARDIEIELGLAAED